VAILPLDNNIKPLKTILPFYLNLKINFPDRSDPKAIKMNKTEFAKNQQHALDPYTAADLFDEWFDRLELPMYKKLYPLAQNWPFDRAFLKEWIGNTSFEHSFSPRYRDSMVAAAFMSDIADFRSEKILFTQYNLRFLCTRLGITNEKPHDALQDCIATAECYRRMILKS